LRQGGYEVGRTVRIEYRFADGRLERLPTLAEELVQIPAALIITVGGPAAALAAKGVTTTIPVVFAPLSDPVRSGLVASLNRPGGNITGIAALTIELDPKRLEMLHELASPIGPLDVLLNPARPDTKAQLEGIKNAARSVGRELVLGHASSVEQIEAVFSAFAQRPVSGVLVAADPFFSSQRMHIVLVAASPVPRNLSMVRIRRCWRAGKLWAQSGGVVPAGRPLRRTYSPRGETIKSSSTAADEIRVCDKSQDR
jgi:putative ABC transport system substrate-binding protein